MKADVEVFIIHKNKSHFIVLCSIFQLVALKEQRRICDLSASGLYAVTSSR